jgi:hypothetical protein
MTSCAKTQSLGVLRTWARTSTIKLFLLGLVPAKAFCVSHSEAAPYGSDKRKIEADCRSSFAISGSLQGWGSFQSVFRRNSQLRRRMMISVPGCALHSEVVPHSSGMSGL